MTTLTAADNEVLTPTVRRLLRRSLFWLGISTIILLLALVGILATGSGAKSGEPLSPGSAAPTGTRALVQVLEDEGVTVESTTSLQQTRQAVRDPAGTTLVIHDQLLLDETQLRDALELTDTVVLLDPSFTLLEATGSGILQAGIVEDAELSARCSLVAAEEAGSISGAGSGYRTGDSSAIACFASGDGVYSLVQAEQGSTTITVLGATGLLTNEHILEHGNAALALNLLGSKPHLIWYMSSEEDLAPGSPTTAELSPEWVVPVSIALVLTFIAAAVWRGRRFGPLIVENLPVVVRASETMQGRARLYEHSSARLHALDSLRIGTIDRLARQLGLSTLATVDEVARGVSAFTGVPHSEVLRMLLDAVPANDRALVELSDQLLILEQAVARKLRQP